MQYLRKFNSRTIGSTKSFIDLGYKAGLLKTSYSRMYVRFRFWEKFKECSHDIDSILN